MIIESSLSSYHSSFSTRITCLPVLKKDLELLTQDVVSIKRCVPVPQEIICPLIVFGLFYETSTFEIFTVDEVEFSLVYQIHRTRVCLKFIPIIYNN